MNQQQRPLAKVLIIGTNEQRILEIIDQALEASDSVRQETVKSIQLAGVQINLEFIETNGQQNMPGYSYDARVLNKADIVVFLFSTDDEDSWEKTLNWYCDCDAKRVEPAIYVLVEDNPDEGTEVHRMANEFAEEYNFPLLDYDLGQRNMVEQLFMDLARFYMDHLA